MKISDFRTFLHLMKKRNASEEDYFAFQNFQAERTLEDMARHNVFMKGKKTLDLGCGQGGYTEVFYKHGARITATDFHEPTLLRKRHPDIPWFFSNLNAGINTQDTFQFIYCCSVIEHIKNQENLISEIYRVLDKNGELILSFTPFYAPLNGGHIYSPFHYLPEQYAVKIASFIRKKQYSSYETTWGDWGLYKTTLRSVGRMLEQKGFSSISTWTKYLPINFSRTPFLNEYCTWHVVFYCKK